MNKIILILSCLLTGPVMAQQTYPVRLTVSEPCYVTIRDASGNHYIPDSTYFWKSFMGPASFEYPIEKKLTIRLAPGKYYYDADRGPEYLRYTDSFIVAGKGLTVRVRPKRLVNMSKKGWWSGELHIHRNQNQMEQLRLAADLHVAPVMISWNDHYEPAEGYTGGFGAEDERGGGAILVLNTPEPMDFRQLPLRESPPLSASVMKVDSLFPNQHWIDIEKSFWWDLPILISTGKIKSVGIAHNHMHRHSILDNEAWGRERDRNLYPPPHGNGLYTHDIYFKLLNSGIRIPPSAGSASGVLPNPVGYNRMYVFQKRFSRSNWFEQAAKGHLFVTNGPMLICEVNGKIPGEVLGTGLLQVSGEVISRDPVSVIQIIKNGSVVASIDPEGENHNRFQKTIAVDGSGWLMVRAISKIDSTFRFAATAPWYIEADSKEQFISKSAAEYFLRWTEERSAQISVSDPAQRAEIDHYIDNARKFWRARVDNATAE